MNVASMVGLLGGRHRPYAAGFVLYAHVLSPWQHHNDLNALYNTNILESE